MKIRGLVIACLVLLILAGTLYWSERRGLNAATTNASAAASPAILKLDQAAITSVELKKQDAEPILLTKVGSGKWQITEPKPFGADQNAVSSMLSTLSSLNSERLVVQKAVDVKPYGLASPALEVDITEKDNKTQKLLLGDETPTGGAVYAMLAGDPRVFTVSEYGKTIVDKSLNDLRDKRLLTVNSISRIELIKKNQEIEFDRNQKQWQILKPKPFRADHLVINELASQLTGARMDLTGVDASDAGAAFAHAAPVVIAKVTGASGAQELQIRENNGQYYAKSSAVEGAYKVDSSLGLELDKGLDDFRNKQLFDFGFSTPDKVELHSGAKVYFLARSGQDWWSNGKKMDATSVQSFLATLRELKANKFVESGFTNPVIEATVTSEDGKRVEKVSIAKSGNAYIAKREDGPGLYQLDTSSIDDLLKSADAMKPVTTQASK